MIASAGWIEEARLRLDDATHLLEREREARAVSAAYFACHAAGRGLLQSVDVQVRTHSGLRNRIGYHFVRVGQCTPDVTRWLAELEQVRQEADYDLRTFERNEAERCLAEAQRCVEELASALEAG